MLRPARVLMPCFILVCAALTATAQPPKLTPEQQEKIKVRNGFLKDARSLQVEGKFAEARSKVEKGLALEREVYGEKHARVVDVLIWLSKLSSRAEDFPTAKDYGTQAVTLSKTANGDTHWKTADARLAVRDADLLAGLTKQQRADLEKATSQHNLAVSLESRGQFAKAEPLFVEALAMRKALLGEKHPDSATTMQTLGYTYLQLGSFAKAESLLQQVPPILKEALGDNHPNYATSLVELAALYRTRGLYVQVEPLLRQALAAYKAGVGDKDPDYLITLNNLATLYDTQGVYAKAEPLYQEILAVWKAVLGVKHPYYATTLNNLGILYKSQGLFQKAEPLLTEAMTLRKAVLGEKHPDYTNSLNNLGILAEAQGFYAKAEAYLKDALAIRTATLGEKHPTTIGTLNDLATVYSSQGRYKQAEPLLKEVLALQKSILGEKHPDYAASQQNLAVHYHARGLWTEAESLFRQALETNRAVFGAKHPTYAMSLDSYGVQLFEQGQFARGEALLLEAKTIREAALGKEHPDYAGNLNNLAMLYAHRGLHEKAASLNEEAVKVWKQTVGESHPYFATALTNLGHSYHRQQKDAKAEEFYQEAMAIRKSVWGARHPDYANSLHHLGALYLDQGKFAKAEPLLKEALSIREASLGETHPVYASTMSLLAVLYARQGLPAKADPFQRKATEIILEHLDRSAAMQSELGQLIHLAQSRGYLNSWLTFPKSDPVEVYAAALQWRGAVTARQTFARVASDTDPAVRQTVEELREVSERLSSLVNNPVKPGLNVPELLKKLDDQRETLEQKLALQAKDFANYRSNRVLKPADIQKLLPVDAVLVDFLVYGDKVAAFIVTPKSIVRKDLPVSVSDLAALVNNFRDESSLKRSKPVQGQDDKSALWEVVWAPLVPHLNGASLVLICPDGPLCNLPFAALRGSDPKKYLIEEVAIAVIPVPKLLPELLAERPVAPPALLLVGDVDFGGDPGAGKLPGATNVLSPLRAGGALAWKFLPGTKKETETIEALFRECNPNAVVKSLSKAEATEAAIRRAVADKRYLHLATHGFFAKASETPNPDALIRSPGDRIRAAGLNPGLLCGVVCAGANNPTADVDGVLTALEIADLNLRRVELAVLSACETGLGVVFSGDGVLSLQRSFQLAGARTTVTSLWKVDDEVTGVLMTRFYENRLKKKMPTLEALREAQSWVLNNGVKAGALTEEPMKGRRTPPKYWAAFVLAGDWR